MNYSANKKTLLLTIIALSTAIHANAADISKPNWDGFYAGLALGHGSSYVKPESKIEHAGYFNEIGTASDENQVNPILQGKIKESSLTGSALLGYNFQSGNFVYGIEADLTRINSSLSKSYGPITYDTAPTHTFNTNVKVKSDYQFSVRPKIGYAKDNFLFFASLGPSISRFETTHTYSDTLLANSSVSEKKTVVGLSDSIGAGYATGNGWSLRGEYIVSKYSNIFDSDEDFDNDGDADDINYKSDFKSRNFRIALIKQF
jgi:outer membrane immunogenic protein